MQLAIKSIYYDNRRRATVVQVNGSAPVGKTIYLPNMLALCNMIGVVVYSSYRFYTVVFKD